jgi:hypothetical protein
MERRKESRKKRDKSDGKKIEIRLVFYVGKGFPFRALLNFLTPTFSLLALLCASKSRKETVSHIKNFHLQDNKM